MSASHALGFACNASMNLARLLGVKAPVPAPSVGTLRWGEGGALCEWCKGDSTCSYIR